MVLQKLLIDPYLQYIINNARGGKRAYGSPDERFIYPWTKRLAKTACPSLNLGAVQEKAQQTETTTDHELPATCALVSGKSSDAQQTETTTNREHSPELPATCALLSDETIILENIATSDCEPCPELVETYALSDESNCDAASDKEWEHNYSIITKPQHIRKVLLIDGTIVERYTSISNLEPWPAVPATADPLSEETVIEPPTTTSDFDPDLVIPAGFGALSDENNFDTASSAVWGHNYSVKPRRRLKRKVFLKDATNRTSVHKCSQMRMLQAKIKSLETEVKRLRTKLSKCRCHK
ncbi:unnamed protein product [Parnassius apollo]|uniref:(apollo) hypothetical protein n=1 Tax=Parnassius apollo TaxID=110799 RepID=A0A8S3X6T2_PARAO|nr:unnamed protein product [Parnassius apollo]